MSLDARGAANPVGGRQHLSRDRGQGHHQSGTTLVVFNWDYLNHPVATGVPRWKAFILPGGPGSRRPRVLIRADFSRTTAR
jgi:hypothetical protein